MNTFLSFIYALYVTFLYVNPLSLDSPYETAEYFASYDRHVDSWENAELFESLGVDFDLNMDRLMHDAPFQTFYTDVTIGDELFDGYSSMMVEEPVQGDVIHIEWDAPIPDVTDKIVVLPMTEASFEARDDAYHLDHYGEVLNDEAANRYLTKLKEAGAAGYLITPHPDAQDEFGFVHVSAWLRFYGTGVGTETAEMLTDGQTVTIEPYESEMPYTEFVQTGTTDEEVIVMARLDSSGYGDHALTGLGGASILYQVIQAMDDVKTKATIRYVFLNGYGEGYEASTHYLGMLEERDVTTRTVMLLDLIGTGDTDRFVKTHGMKSYPFMDSAAFEDVEVRSLGVSILDEYRQAGIDVISMNDSLTASQDVFTEDDTIDRLSDDAMREHVDWLVEWLTTQ
ncbi:M28 family peptidase [Exiguobacterium sp. s150]|uniref:M28 family peptidase n=1 Tax=Exiguobacterium sp. s150 TaxID=2751221 RepID=UPI001BEBF6F5|nr:M28 family peptidase [Exiguobacterium sp. s150]